MPFRAASRRSAHRVPGRHPADRGRFVGVVRDDDIHVLGPAHYAPRAERKPTYHHELDLGIRQATEDLVKRWLALRLRAVPARRRYAWLSAMVSARLTLIGRRESACIRRARIASEAALALVTWAGALPAPCVESGAMVDKVAEQALLDRIRGCTGTAAGAEGSRHSLRPAAA